MRIHLVVPGRRPAFPDDLVPLPDGLVALGGDIEPALLKEAYAKGIFPWTGEHPIPWYSPDPRLILLPAHLHVARRLERTVRQGRFEVRYDTAFRKLMGLCADAVRDGQDGTWITENMFAGYGALHDEGVAHSVEVWRDGELVGGIYGLAVGAAFFGESMVSCVRDASKVALVHLCRRLEARRFLLLDCQQVTGHMLRMGAVPVGRDLFLGMLREAVAVPDRW